MRLLAKAVAVLASLNAARAYEEAPAYAFDRLPADTPYQTFHALGLEVAYLLDGGGTGFGLDLVRVVFNRFGRGAFKRCMEFCSGGGFIGFTLLALDVCETLVLADINPDNVKSVQETIRRNGLEGRVSVFLSDGFDGIPQSELGTWNLVVSNPPHFKSYFDVSPLHVVGPHTRGLVDLDWVLHRRFYAAVHRFLVPGAAHVIWQENKVRASNALLLFAFRGRDQCYHHLAGINVGSRFFFLCDTSGRVAACGLHSNAQRDASGAR